LLRKAFPVACVRPQGPDAIHGQIGKGGDLLVPALLPAASAAVRETGAAVIYAHAAALLGDFDASAPGEKNERAKKD